VSLKTLWKPAFAVLIGAICAGGTVYLWQQSVLRTVQAQSDQACSEIRRQAIEVSNELYRVKADAAEAQLALNRKSSDQLFEIYTMEERYGDPYIKCYVAIPEDLPLAQRLSFLAQNLTEIQFPGLPIHIRKTENRQGLKIAHVELIDLSREYTWEQRFQGSTGGGITQTALTYTLLQPDHKGEWIDGLKFFYRGLPVENEYDHVDLSGILLRSEIKTVAP
jgi:hypothetical protein